MRPARSMPLKAPGCTFLGRATLEGLNNGNPVLLSDGYLGSLLQPSICGYKLVASRIEVALVIVSSPGSSNPFVESKLVLLVGGYTGSA